MGESGDERVLSLHSPRRRSFANPAWRGKRGGGRGLARGRPPSPAAPSVRCGRYRRVTARSLLVVVHDLVVGLDHVVGTAGGRARGGPGGLAARLALPLVARGLRLG